MLGDFITRIIILLVGYAYPAYGCYKSVEKKKLEIQELSHWCKYWILVSLLTVFERIGDIFVSWLPFYGEIKIALLVYLWYPKSQGISYVYETLLRPYMSRHEFDIDQGISILKIRLHSVIVQTLQCGYLWFFKIFKHLQQQFAIDKVLSDTVSPSFHEFKNLPNPFTSCSAEEPIKVQRETKDKNFVYVPPLGQQDQSVATLATTHNNRFLNRPVHQN